MPKQRRKVVWFSLQISEQAAAFAESQWRNLGYANRDDYLNALLNTAIMNEMPPEAHEAPKGRLYPEMGDDLPF